MSPFITTSDVINQLNKHIMDLSNCDDDEDDAGFDSGDLPRARFELQKRLPDGSAIPATRDEAAAADFKTKLDQAVKFVSLLESREDRHDWAEQQRRAGNAFFQQGDYKGAMDIYLTCLVVKENTPDFVRDTLLPVLNNLAQCTLQLGMHKKTIVFCETALEEFSKAKKMTSKAQNDSIEKEQHENEEPSNGKSALEESDAGDAIALCKIHFKLGKALRLTGHYREARKALNSSLEYVIQKENTLPISSCPTAVSDAAKISASFAPYRKAINKEFRCLEIAEKEARRNRARQKRAMQTVLSSAPISKSNPSSLQGNSTDQPGSVSQQPLYEKSEPRQFSRLRADKSPSTIKERKNSAADAELDTLTPSYRQYYWAMVARVAKALLLMLGDEEDIDNERFSNVNAGKKKASKKAL
eukprot:jgi/Psemu1/298897/fgenesh1_pm.806_\